MNAVIIISGGIDSVTLLHKLVKGNNSIEALSFDYGQRHVKEIEFAKYHCNLLGVNHQVVCLKNISHLISNSALTGNISVPDGHYKDESMKKTVVPNRNMIMLSIAIGYAENIGFDYVAIANHAGDHAIYPDCRTEFINALSIASSIGTYNSIKIYAPFSNISKKDIVYIGNSIGIDYTKTWSCYKGIEFQCGTCGTCVERLEALS